MPQWTGHQPHRQVYDHMGFLMNGAASHHPNQNHHISGNASSYVNPYLYVPPRATLQASVIQLLQDKRGFTQSQISLITEGRDDDNSLAALLNGARQVEYRLPDIDSLLSECKKEPSLSDFGGELALLLKYLKADCQRHQLWLRWESTCRFGVEVRR